MAAGMKVVILLCAGITSPHPGCIERAKPLYDNITPMACANKVQEVLAKDWSVDGDYQLMRYRCDTRGGRD